MLGVLGVDAKTGFRLEGVLAEVPGYQDVAAELGRRASVGHQRALPSAGLCGDSPHLWLLAGERASQRVVPTRREARVQSVGHKPCGAGKVVAYRLNQRRGFQGLVRGEPGFPSLSSRQGSGGQGGYQQEQGQNGSQRNKSTSHYASTLL